MAFIQDALRDLDASFQVMNPFILSIISALLILFIGFIIGKLVGNLLRKLFQAITLDLALSKLLKTRIRLQRLLAGFVALVIYFFTAVLALHQVGILSLFIQYLSLIIVLLVVLTLLLSLKDILPSFFIGFVIRKKLKLKRGQSLAFNGISGTVKEFTLIDLLLLTNDGDLLLMPYTVLQKKVLKTKTEK